MKQLLTVYAPMSKEECTEAARKLRTTPEEIWEMQNMWLASGEAETSRDFPGAGRLTLKRYASCMCIAEVCAHPNGERCGKPVEKPVGYIYERKEPERPIGLCEECWKRVNI